jgi:hypothetical protein
LPHTGEKLREMEVRQCQLTRREENRKYNRRNIIEDTVIEKIMGKTIKFNRKDNRRH